MQCVLASWLLSNDWHDHALCRHHLGQGVNQLQQRCNARRTGARSHWSSNAHSQHHHCSNMCDRWHDDNECHRHLDDQSSRHDNTAQQRHDDGASDSEWVTRNWLRWDGSASVSPSADSRSHSRGDRSVEWDLGAGVTSSAPHATLLGSRPSGDSTCGAAGRSLPG